MKLVDATASPVANPVTPVPSSSTVPAPSLPGVIGNEALYTPLRKYTSMKLTPVASIRTSTCPGPGTGMGQLNKLKDFRPASRINLNGFHDPIRINPEGAMPQGNRNREQGTENREQGTGTTEQKEVGRTPSRNVSVSYQ